METITKDNVHTTRLYKEMKQADPNAYYFQDFLVFLAEEHDFDRFVIIDVMYNSHKYIPRYYNDFLVRHCLDVYSEPTESTF